MVVNQKVERLLDSAGYHYVAPLYQAEICQNVSAVNLLLERPDLDLCKSYGKGFPDYSKPATNKIRQVYDDRCGRWDAITCSVTNKTTRITSSVQIAIKSNTVKIYDGINRKDYKIVKEDADRVDAFAHELGFSIVPSRDVSVTGGLGHSHSSGRIVASVKNWIMITLPGQGNPR